MQLICPKCSAQMRTYERNGIHIDQCTSCRGIFLDSGELEHLTRAETSFYQAPSSFPAGSNRSAEPQYGYGKKKKSFLTELLDF